MRRTTDCLRLLCKILGYTLGHPMKYCFWLNTRQPLRCDIPVVLVKILKLNSRRLKSQNTTLLYYIIYIYMAEGV